MATKTLQKSVSQISLNLKYILVDHCDQIAATSHCSSISTGITFQELGIQKTKKKTEKRAKTCKNKRLYFCTIHTHVTWSATVIMKLSGFWLYWDGVGWHNSFAMSLIDPTGTGGSVTWRSRAYHVASTSWASWNSIRLLQLLVGLVIDRKQ